MSVFLVAHLVYSIKGEFVRVLTRGIGQCFVEGLDVPVLQ